MSKALTYRGCKHNHGFHCTTSMQKETGLPGVWKCSLNCGFFLNFSPDKYPKGIAYVLSNKEEKVIIFKESKF